MNKPRQQTILPPAYVPTLLQELELRKIQARPSRAAAVLLLILMRAHWAQGFGGKLGHAIAELGDVRTPADIVSRYTEMDLRVRAGGRSCRRGRACLTSRNAETLWRRDRHVDMAHLPRRRRLCGQGARPLSLVLEALRADSAAVCAAAAARQEHGGVQAVPRRQRLREAHAVVRLPASLCSKPV